MANPQIVDNILEIQGTKYFVPDECRNDGFYKPLQLKNEVFEFGLILLLLEYIKSDSVVIDIGGHVGNHSMQFAKKAKKVYSFEPISQNYTLFEKNMVLNNIKNVELFKIALSDNKCNLSINEEKSKFSINSGAVFLKQSVQGTIKADSLDNVLFSSLDDEVSVIKIDVEEMEYPVIIGAKKIIEKFHPIIYTEIFRPREGSEQKLKSIQEFLNPLGYVNYYMKEFSGDIWV